MKIKITNLVKGKKTYHSWASNLTCFIRTKEEGENVLIYYLVKGNRMISRIFPKEIELTPNLSYTFGLLRGEGSTSLGKSIYRRVTITNSDPKIIRTVFK